MKELPKVYFERLLESSPDIVIAVDRKGKVIFYNDGAEDSLGYEADEVLGEPVARLYAGTEEARAVLSAMRDETIDGVGLVKNFETELIDKSGTAVPVAISGSIIHDHRGRELGSIGFLKDIRVLREHDRLLTLGELAVGLAHEINNPLEVLVNHIQLLERYLRQKATAADYSREHERIDSIKRELRHIQSIVERVGEMAAGGDYGTREYLPGRLMTDLGSDGDSPPTPAENGTATVAGVDAGNSAHPGIVGKTVLVVDDDCDVRESMADILSAEGCMVVTTDSGVEALRYLSRSTVDLIVSDVMMPDMDGYELFQELQNRHADVPVVLMTAYYYDKEHVIKRSRAEGLEDVIYKKPIDPERLLELVEARAGG